MQVELNDGLFVVGLQEGGGCYVWRSECVFTNYEKALAFAKERLAQVFVVHQAPEDK